MTETTRYRAKPFEIEARQLIGGEGGEPARALAAWCGGWIGGSFTEPHIVIPTLEGEMRATVGDWIIRGVQGEFYPCRDDIFRATYEPAAEAQQPETQPVDRATIIAEILPAWEAVYEPGNVSDYLIGYANSEAAAKGAAEAWMRSQAEVTGRLEWVPEERLATGRYDQWFELIERHDGGIDTGPGLIVRRRVTDEARVGAGERR